MKSTEIYTVDIIYKMQFPELNSWDKAVFGI